MAETEGFRNTLHSRSTPPAPPFSILAREIFTHLTGMIRSELRLARVEATSTVKSAGRQSGKFAVAAVLSLVAAFTLLASVVIALGDWWGGRYALSSLVVGIVCLSTATILAVRAFKSIQQNSLPVTRRALRDGQEFAQESVHQLSQHVRSSKASRGKTQ